MSETLGTTVLIGDRDSIIAVSGGSKKEFLDKNIGSIVEKVMDDRRTLLVNRIQEEVDKNYLSLIDTDEDNDITAFCIAPIIPWGCHRYSDHLFQRSQSQYGRFGAKVGGDCRGISGKTVGTVN